MAKQSPQNSFLRRHGPLGLFATLTLGGIAFIVTAKLSGLSTPVVTGIPIAIMLAYMAISLAAEALRLHNDQVGDNLYYMGFLFTLTSLGVSLYRFADETSIDQIVQNFGIAVSSTICGIALRIFFNQMRRDPIDIERSARHELAEMTRRVRSELDTSAREFSNYRRTSNQMLVEGFDEIARQAEQTGASVQRAIEALSRESIKPIQDASEKLAAISEQNLAMLEQRANRLTELSEEAAQKLNLASTRISDFADAFSRSLETMSDKFEKMKFPDDVLRVELSPAIAAIREAGELQKRLCEDSASRLDQHAEETLKALRPLSEIPDRIHEALGLVKTLHEPVNDALKPSRPASAPSVGAVSFDAAQSDAHDLSISQETRSAEATSKKRRFWPW
ncbi:MAG: hypothetical protein CML23_01545 [Rhizobiaceae bacterium]|nr:hypothetical protein [Rhizobiaceae bacterium]